jgi:hypothetical protein
LQLLVLVHKDFLVLVMHPHLGLPLLLQFVLGNLRKEMIGHRVLKCTKNIKHKCETHCLYVKLATQVPKCE